MSGGDEVPSRLWGGRFREGPAPELDRLNRSLPLDWCLWRLEIALDRAWLTELERLGTVTPEEAVRLRGGLEAVERRLADGSPAEEPDEDVHTLVERWLTEEVGVLASRIRLGRSRNDVAATGTRAWALAAADTSSGAIAEVQRALVERAAELVDLPFPAYSHLQRAQPTRAAHWLLSHFWPLQRGRERLRDVRRRLGLLPLGSAAGTGSTLRVDRERLAAELGFEAPAENALDAVGSRDWAAELLFAWTMTAVDASRLAEELVLFSTSEFGLLRLADAWTTGSSLMPHKRNPDGAELARARAGVLTGLLTGLLSVLKGLPSGYSKDLQEDKAALFAAERGLSEALAVLAGSVREMEVRADAARRALRPEMLAADAAEMLAAEGLSFREAHEAVGALVLRAEELGLPLPEVDAAERAAIHPALAGLAPEVWDVEAALERRAARGGSSRRAVLDQLQAARERLEE